MNYILYCILINYLIGIFFDIEYRFIEHYKILFMFAQ